MAFDFTEVRSGDVITSSLINALGNQLESQVAQLEQLEQRVDSLQPSTPGTGTIVPKLFGMNLAQARVAVANAGLSIDRVFLANGTEVSKLDPTRQLSVVLGQEPGSGVRVIQGSFIGLMIAPQTADPPTIESIDPSPGTAGTPVVVNGQNFSGNTESVEVTFNGVPGEVTRVRTHAIDVRIPNVFPGVPDDNSSTTNVEVRVQTLTGNTTFADYPVRGPITEDIPVIDNVSGQFIPSGEISFTGGNLDVVEAVRFVVSGNEFNGVIKTSSPSELIVNAPSPDSNFNNALKPSGAWVDIHLVVSGESLANTRHWFDPV